MSTFDQLLASSGMTTDSLGLPPAHLDGGSVPLDAEVARVLALPRRPACDDAFRVALSCYCRTRALDDNGEPNELRPEQAESIRECLLLRGLFADIEVGGGKTLVGMLLPWLLQSTRPVLMLPAAMIPDTKRDFVGYRRNWSVRLPEMISYQEMGRPDRQFKLEQIRPDLIVMDEAQWLRNLDSAVARRVERYIAAYRPVVVTMSGTLITDDPIDMHAPAVWSLGVNAPLPIDRGTAEQWAKALNSSGLAPPGTGALDLLPGGFYNWFLDSRGVVSATSASSSCKAELQISRWIPNTPDALRQLIAAVAVSGMRPDGELLDEWELPDCLCQLALGFYYVWDPLPPEWWRLPRKAWRVWVRRILDMRLPAFDSEAQVVNALDATKRGLTLPPEPNEGRAKLAAWRAVRDHFVPNPVPVWLDDSVVRQAADLARSENAIVWVKHRATGWAMQHLGVPYYGGGTDPRSAPTTHAIACSIQAHSEGKNLQARCNALVLHPPADALKWEQLIGRKHRAGQKHPRVHYRIINSIEYHSDVIDRVRLQAGAVAKNKRRPQKLTSATWL